MGSELGNGFYGARVTYMYMLTASDNDVISHIWPVNTPVDSSTAHSNVFRFHFVATKIWLASQQKNDKLNVNAFIYQNLHALAQRKEGVLSRKISWNLHFRVKTQTTTCRLKTV